MKKAKINNEKFTLSSNKIEKDYLISFMGDLHMRETTKYEFIDSILKKIYETNPNFVIFDGDIAYDSDDFYNSQILERLNYFVSMLTKKYPLLFVSGNHELKIGKSGLKPNLEFLTNFSNVEILDNKQITIDNLSLTGFAPSENGYFYSKEEEFYNCDTYINEFKNSNFSFDKDKYNIFITHDPIMAKNKYVIEKLSAYYKSIDLILSAHLHNGYIPQFIQDIFPSIADKGIGIFKLKEKVPCVYILNNCRGLSTFDETQMVVTRGIRKQVLKNALFDKIDEFCSHDITTLELTKK